MNTLIVRYLTPWRNETYPTYSVPFVYLENGKPKCDLAEFGLRPFWAKDKRFSTKTYNARSEIFAEKPSYKNACAKHQFGFCLMDNF